jgi:hypothetical protein
MVNYCFHYEWYNCLMLFNQKQCSLLFCVLCLENFWTLQPRNDFWTPIDRTPVERPVVGLDDMTQDPNETQGSVDC